MNLRQLPRLSITLPGILSPAWRLCRQFLNVVITGSAARIDSCTPNHCPRCGHQLALAAQLPRSLACCCAVAASDCHGRRPFAIPLIDAQTPGPFGIASLFARQPRWQSRDLDAAGSAAGLLVSWFAAPWP